MDSPRKVIFEEYFVVSCIFICLPWIVNLSFLLFAKLQWQELNGDQSHLALQMDRSQNTKTQNSVNLNALSQSFEKAQKWLSSKSKFLVVICVISGSMVASLKLVNCRLFGLKWFDMGLARYKQEEFGRHRLWLTVTLENVPQIILAISYASFLNEFDNTTVLFALTSSILSVLIAVWSAVLQYPKKFYIFQLDVFLQQPDKQLQRKIRKTKSIASRLCNAFDQEYGFCFVENAFVINDKHIMFNVVTSEANVLKNQLDKKQKVKIMDGLKQHRKLKLNIKNIKWSKIDSEIITLVCCDIHVKSNTSVSKSKDISVKQVKNDATPAPTESARDSQTSSSPIVIITGDDDDEKVQTMEIESKHKQRMSDIVNINSGGNVKNSTSAVPMGRGLSRQRIRKHGGSSVGSVSVVSTKGWRSWTCDQVSDWIEQLLMNDQRLVDEDYIVDTFINEFNKHRVDGQIIQLFKNDAKAFEKFENKFVNNSFTIWLIVTKSINDLK